MMTTLIDVNTTPLVFERGFGGWDWKAAADEDRLYGYVEKFAGSYHAILADDAGEQYAPTGVADSPEAAVRELLLRLDEEGRLNDALEVEAAGLDALAEKGEL